MISLRLKEDDENLIREYVKLKNTTVSDFIRNTILEKIEDEIDLKAFKEAKAQTTKLYTLDEVEKELDL